MRRRASRPLFNCTCCQLQRLAAMPTCGIRFRLLTCPPVSVQIALSYGALISTPKPLPSDAAPERFAEARALQHTAKLTENGAGRLVSHPSIEAGIHYITAAAQDIVAAAASRHDIRVQVGVN